MNHVSGETVLELGICRLMLTGCVGLTGENTVHVTWSQ